ncbi:MAG: serine/threonine protein phosphatase [Labilithrix sp.]|nr:serine/threonine protein phosphatase [Labilithrix sp.]
MRTIIVGDVHGCRTELEALLDRVAFSAGDRLVFVGDLVARGPDSLGVLDIARRTGAVVVRGNHEQKLLDWRAVGEGASPPKHTLGKMHRDVARALRPVDWTILRNSPTSYLLPEHGALVVHAGLLPGLALAAQNPDTLMRIRTVRPPSEAAGKKGELRLWGEVYAGPPQVVFGHNAAPGLQLHPWATGLDTGCVYGGRLTALVLSPGQRVPRSIEARRALLFSEPARRVWYAPGTAA